MTDIDARLREDVHLLGELLGNTIRAQYGDGFLDKIEQIRKGAKADRRGSMDAELSASLNQLSEDELLPVARAFNQFLNLANIAEQYQLIPVSYTHLRAHETSLHLVCRLLLEKKK